MTEAETIEFECPDCHKFLRAGINLVGTKGKCPSCGKILTVPEKESVGSEEKKQD